MASKLPIHSEAQNKKLADSGIVYCPELEGAEPCIWFSGENLTQSEKCPGCFSRIWHPLRASRWNNSQTTPQTGLIRLGNWREILAKDYDAFQAGHGTRSDGTTWTRPDFPKRTHFVVTRGLEPWSLYSRMLANPLCLNIQVSVDILVTGSGVQQIPDDERLRTFLAAGKTLFRFKTLAAPGFDRSERFERNVEHFQALAQRLNIPPMRVLETPLRLEGNRQYQTATPLEEAGWDSRAFLRCNSSCAECPGREGQAENRVLVCGANERMLQLLQSVGNIQPLRFPFAEKNTVAWTDLTVRAWLELGGTASLQDLYAAVIRLEPAVGERMHHQAKIRQVVQAHGVRVGRGVWRYTGNKTLPLSDVVSVES